MAQKLYLINVLPDEYYKDCHITGSIHMPVETLATRAQELEKDAKILVYCAKYACTASAQAYKVLKNMGFSDVYAYEGGTAEWYGMGFPCEGSCTKDYLTQDNPSPEEDRGVRQISAHELKHMLDEQGSGE